MPIPEDEAPAIPGLPDDVAIVNSLLSNSKVVFGVPDKQEIFRLAELASTDPLGRRTFTEHMRLRIVSLDPSPATLSSFKVAHPPRSSLTTDIVEHNYVVNLQVVTDAMNLSHIKVIYGTRRNDSKAIVFQGTELPGPAHLRRIRFVRVSVTEGGHASYEMLGQTRYPPPERLKLEI